MAVKLIEAKQVVPIHYNTFDIIKQDPKAKKFFGHASKNRRPDISGCSGARIKTRRCNDLKGFSYDLFFKVDSIPIAGLKIITCRPTPNPSTQIF